MLQPRNGPGSFGDALRNVVLPHLKLPPETLSYLSEVLSELSQAELSDFETVRNLLEPFLLDARKPGRERPHDKKSDEFVQGLCHRVFCELQTSTPSPAVEDRKKVAENVAGGPDDAVANALEAPGPTRCDRSFRATEISEDFYPLVAEASALLQAVFISFDADLVIPSAVADHVAKTFLDLPESDLENVEYLSVLLEPFLADAFHECGKWAANEDGEQLMFLASAVSREFLQMLRGPLRHRETGGNVLPVPQSA